MGTVNGEGISGTVLNNRIFLPGTNGIAIKGANTCNWLVQGNYVSGGWAGFYGDSGTYSNMLVAHNVFKNCYTAVSLTFNTRQNLTFSYNTIQLPTNASASAFSFNGLASTNIVITGNNVGFSGARAGTNYFIFGASIAGLLVNNNTVDPACTNYFTACSGVNIYDNFDLNGNSLTTLNQVEPPNGITRTTVNATPYAASYADYYIGVKTTSATALSLPTAVGHPGKEYIIMKEVSNTNNVTVTPAVTEKNNAKTNLVITTGFVTEEGVTHGNT